MKSESFAFHWAYPMVENVSTEYSPAKSFVFALFHYPHKCATWHVYGVIGPPNFHFSATTLAELAQQRERELPEVTLIPSRPAIITPDKEAIENYINIDNYTPTQSIPNSISP